MKTILRLFSTAALCMFCFSLSAQQKEVPKEFLGKWAFTYEDAQTGQNSNGLCTVKQDKEETTAFFELEYGSVSTSALRPNDNGKFYADIEIEGYPILVAFKLDGDTLVCDWDAGSFFISVGMKRTE
jgi:hypothetical protein